VLTGIQSILGKRRDEKYWSQQVVGAFEVVVIRTE
jgi:hypothetical protein